MIAADALCDFHPGDTPLVVSIPHAGVGLPDDVRACLSDEGLQLADTDWFVDRLYAVARGLGATVIAARQSRYVVDLNRPSDGGALYPGQWETAVCPLTTFEGAALYRRGQEPDAAEVQRRLRLWWQPYHDRLARTLEVLRERHGHVVLWDAHSIRSEVPALFAGRLPDFNLGTDGGRSCPPELARALIARAASGGLSTVLDGRFKGGYITRHYGRPQQGTIAVQLELAQAVYMDEQETPRWRPQRAAAMQALLLELLGTVLAYRPGATA